MKEEAKMEVAVFRFGVIGELVTGQDLEIGDQERIIREKCARKWVIPYSSRTSIGRSTILQWIRSYKKGNGDIRSLYPQSRSDKGKSRAMDDETCLNLTSLKMENPKASVRWLMKEMKSRKLVSPGVILCRSNIYRFLNEQGLMRPKGASAIDRRKFEAELPNDLWQSDVMHGPMVMVGDRKRKSYLISFIDDHSRLVPHGEFYLSESLGSYLDAFEQALLRRGLPRKLYVDNGPAFRSKHLEHITATIGIVLIHSRPYKPQGRGKVERFYRTVRGDFLNYFKGETLDDLNEAFELWLNHDYHQRKHSSTGQSPFDRFTSHMECIRPAPSNLKDYFRKAALRRVGKDRTITLNGRLYEAPVPLTGKRVTLLFHENQAENVEILFDQKSYGLAVPVDLHVNCKVRRDHNNDAEIVGEDNKLKGGSLWSPERSGKK